MSEKDKQEQSVVSGQDDDAGAGGKNASKEKKPTKEERLAEALRANLRRRKSAAKSRKDG
ncbi:hypothetical protein [Roseibium sp. SCP14]|uniref:hypothetical protein n=1 Tax=Roseibium sp. SCP14 TaxID=3141375 RepID=UPI00333555BB